MRSDAKAPTAGSTNWSGAAKARLVVLAAALLAFALAAGTAGALQTHVFKEVFGSAAQPTFGGDRGIAVDQGTGDVHVLEVNSDEIRRYNPDGTPSDFSALATNVIDGEGPGDGTPNGNLDFPSSAKESQIAIDESGTATDGDIYVVERARDQITIFNSAGEYIGRLTEHSGGAFNEPLGVTVDPAGNVYVGDFSSADLVHKYEPSANPPVNGDNVASFNSLAGTSSPGVLAAGAGASAGYIFVARFNGELFKLDDTTGELKYQVATGVTTVSVDPATGHVFAARNSGSSSTVDEYDASGATEAELLSTIKPGSTAEGVAVNAAGEIYVSQTNGGTVAVFDAPIVTMPEVLTEAATANTGARATLNGTVNPDGLELDECLFEWTQTSGGEAPSAYDNTVPCAESPAEIGTGTSPVAVHADLGGLVPNGAHYHYRLVAVNPEATARGFNRQVITPDAVFTEAPSGITPTAATLNGTVNPDAEALSACVFEWGPPKGPGEVSQHYPNSAPCVPGPGGIGTGESPVAVKADLSGLHPGTTYLYRLKATYPGGAAIGDTETVQSAGPVIESSWAQDVIFTEATLKARINPEGSATTYRFQYGTSEAYGSQTEELNVGSDSAVHELARFLDGLQPGTTYHWRVVATNGLAENIGPDHILTTYERPVPDTDCPNQAFRTGPGASLPECRAYELVSPVDKAGIDIRQPVNITGFTLGAAQAARDGEKMAFAAGFPFGDAQSGLASTQFIASRGAGGWSSRSINPGHEGNVRLSADLNTGKFSVFSPDLSRGFLYDNAKPPLTPEAIDGHYNAYLYDNLTDTYTALTTELFSEKLEKISLMGYSPDGSHTLFVAEARLTADAAPDDEARQLYDFHDGELELASVLPGGEASPGGTLSKVSSLGGAGNKLNVEQEIGVTGNAISTDGSRIYWTTDFDSGSGNTGRIYARIDGETTIPVSASVTEERNAVFWTASTDGSQAIISVETKSDSDGDLYRYDLATETPTLIASGVHPHTGVLGTSADTSKVYFLSREALAPGAIEGEPNLYLDEEGTKTMIATLAEKDEIPHASLTGPTANNSRVESDFSQVTPDGNHVVFQSQASLTGYDNTSLTDGEPAVEIYTYDATAGKLSCVSCNPGGGRPQTRKLPDGHFYFEEPAALSAAASLPTPRYAGHIPRMVAEDGSYVFFNSFDGLVPADTNGTQDVYEWVAQGVGDCAEAEGCVGLISTGKSPERSTFIDASEGGRDLFFRTSSSIDPDDTGLRDIYDARVNGGYPRRVPPPPCVGDGCQSPPPAPSDPSPASAGFRGAGDPKPVRNCRTQARRAAKLSRRAKLLRRRAKRARAPRQAKALRKRSARYAKQAKRASKGAVRCRRAKRRAAR